MEDLLDYTWIFSGIGTEIIIGIVAIVFGGVVTYKVIRKRNVRQQQTAGKNSRQFQSMTLSNSSLVKINRKSDIKLNQIQKAGDNSNQIQIGGIKDDE